MVSIPLGQDLESRAIKPHTAQVTMIRILPGPHSAGQEPDLATRLIHVEDLPHDPVPTGDAVLHAPRPPIDEPEVGPAIPFRHPDHAVLAKDMTAIQQLETVKWLQENWSDNSVSCTVYYRKEELPEIRKYLKKNYKNNHKSLSFLLHNEHGFKQAPLEEITKEQYDELVAKTRLITSIDSLDIGLDDSECASGACPIR